MMKSIARILTLASASLIAGCATAADGDFCEVAAAIRPSASDRLTGGTAEQILKHNRYGAQACG